MAHTEQHRRAVEGRRLSFLAGAQGGGTSFRRRLEPVSNTPLSNCTARPDHRPWDAHPAAPWVVVIVVVLVVRGWTPEQVTTLLVSVVPFLALATRLRSPQLA